MCQGKYFSHSGTFEITYLKSRNFCYLTIYKLKHVVLHLKVAEVASAH